MADWTVMVYMNGDNNLKPFALANFLDMAKIGSTDKLHIVVQFDSIKGYSPLPAWTQTLRFHMSTVGPGKPATRALPADAVPISEGGVNQELDMGKGQTLSDFVEWAAAKYRAKRYALIIWDHGQGYRADPATGGQIKVFRSATLSPFKTVSNDETNRSQLYVRDIQDSLQRSLQRLSASHVLSRPRFDLIGFDACLMAMVETAYAMRQDGDVMVGSQDLEPGDGWRYNDWLGKLKSQTDMDAAPLGRLLVQSYRDAYGNANSPASDPTTTLSEIDLTKMDALAKAISGFSKALSENMSTLYPQIKAARAATPVYAPNAYNEKPPKEYFFHVDLGKFVSELLGRVNDSNLSSLGKSVNASLGDSVLAHYAGSARQSFGSNGLCIYFPASLTIYQGDRFAENGYEKNNPKWPVQFVDDQLWSDFLHAYFMKVQ